MHLLRGLFIILSIVLSGTALATEDTLHITNMPTADTAILSNGQTVQLAGILAPQPGSDTQKPWPYFVESVGIAAQLLNGKLVSIESAETYLGKTHAVLRLQDGSSAQQLLLAAGVARVYTTNRTAALANDLYRHEAAAREDGKGLWALRTYAVQTPESIKEHEGRFAVVQGAVLDVATISGTTYLNFGADWRTDFTAGMPSTVAKELSADLLQNSHVRVRGWVFNKNGPFIVVTHPQQIEILHAE